MSKKHKKVFERAVAAFVGLTVTGILVVGGTIPIRLRQASNNVELIETYLTENKEGIEREVETRLGIAIDDVTLKFVDDFDDLTLPTASMTYRDGVVTVARNEALPFLERPTGWYIPVYTFETCKGNYEHELGHHYTMQLENLLGAGRKVHPSHSASALNITEYTLRRRIIYEGIGDYFSVATGENKPAPPIYGKPKDLDDLMKIQGHRDQYELGRRIVTPILDSLGVEEGIIAILTQPIITENEMIHPEQYQYRIVQDHSQTRNPHE